MSIFTSDIVIRRNNHENYKYNKSNIIGYFQKYAKQLSFQNQYKNNSQKKRKII